MEVVAEHGLLDVLLDDIRGDPKKASQVMDDVLKQSGIEMTPMELKWLGDVAAKVSALQQNPDFATEIALEMLSGKSGEEAKAAASKALWQDVLNREIASRNFEALFSQNENPDMGNQTAAWNEQIFQQEVIELDEAGVENVREKRFQDLLEKADTSDIIEFDDELEDIVAGKSFEELEPLIEKLPDRAARKWYLAQDALIPSQIDRSLDIEGQARQAFDLRNQNRTRTRDLMLDQEARKGLDISDPNKTFEEMVAYKIGKYHFNREQAIEDILRTATITRQSVNEKFRLEG